MRILALDQSTKHTGWSLWQNKGLLKYGVLDTDEKASPFIRMQDMGKQISNLIRRAKPDHVVIEQVQFQRNYKVYSQLSQLQGVIMQILFERNIAFTLVEPTRWRAFDGIKNRRREETKAAAIQAVKDRFYIEVSEDTAEAIGIGLWAIENVEDNDEQD